MSVLQAIGRFLYAIRWLLVVVLGFFVKPKETGDDVAVPEILSDHPDSASRIREIKREAERLGCDTEPADASRWLAFQQSLPQAEAQEAAPGQ